MGECSVLTYNICADLPQYRHLERRLELIASAVAREQPHLVGFQELVRARACGNLADRLCQLVNRFCEGARYGIEYAAADGAGEGEWAYDEGPAIMARIAATGSAEVLSYTAQVELRASVGGQDYRLPDNRVAIHRRFLTGDHRQLDFYVTHLTDQSAANDGDRVRLAQARELLAWIGSTADSRSAIVATGDFNAPPDSETVQTFTRAGFVDAFEAAGSGLGHTNDRDDLDLTAPQALANQRIDYVFVRLPNGSNSGIKEARLFLDQPIPQPGGGWLWGSDHFGVLVRLEL